MGRGARGVTRRKRDKLEGDWIVINDSWKRAFVNANGGPETLDPHKMYFLRPGVKQSGLAE
jgi:hypothetical protein